MMHSPAAPPGPYSFIPGLSLGVAYFVAIGLPLIVLFVIVFISVALAVPRLRTRLFPFRDRIHWQPSAKRRIDTPGKDVD